MRTSGLALALLLATTSFVSADQTANQQLDTRKSVCRSLVVLLGSTANRSEILVEEAREFQNPLGWETVLIAEYTRPSDGTQWRYLCGISEGKINWSMVSEDGLVGGRWKLRKPDPEITYKIEGDSVTFSERYSDNNVLNTRLPL